MVDFMNPSDDVLVALGIGRDEAAAELVEKDARLSALEAENAGLRARVTELEAQLADPLRLGRGPTLEEIETVAAKESDGIGWWYLSFDEREPAIDWELCSLDVDDGTVILDGLLTDDVLGRITDAIPLNAARQPCGVGVKV